LEIKKLDLGKVLVQLNSYESANRLVNNHSLTASNLKAFIPPYRTGVVRDIPQDVPLETLKEYIFSPIKILELHRLNRRLKSGNDIQYMLSRTLCIKFAGQSLPNFIYFHNCIPLSSPKPGSVSHVSGWVTSVRPVRVVPGVSTAASYSTLLQRSARLNTPRRSVLIAAIIWLPPTSALGSCITKRLFLWRLRKTFL